jgi:hypothetical protein
LWGSIARQDPHKICNYLLIIRVTAIADVFVDPPLVISSTAPSSSTLLAPVGATVIVLLADPDAV